MEKFFPPPPKPEPKGVPAPTFEQLLARIDQIKEAIAKAKASPRGLSAQTMANLNLAIQEVTFVGLEIILRSIIEADNESGVEH